MSDSAKQLLITTVRQYRFRNYFVKFNAKTIIEQQLNIHNVTMKHTLTPTKLLKSICTTKLASSQGYLHSLHTELEHSVY